MYIGLMCPRDREQELSNYLQQKDYVQAVGVAINLDQPFRVFTVLSGAVLTRNKEYVVCIYIIELCYNSYILFPSAEVLDEGGEEGVFKDTLSALRPDQIRMLALTTM